jgi:hypothetical protein
MKVESGAVTISTVKGHTSRVESGQNMTDNAFIKIGTALLKHQVKKLVGEDTLGVVSEEFADIGGDRLDAWLGERSTIKEIEKAAKTAQECFHASVGDHELEQWMASLPIGDLPKVSEALEKLPTSSNEKALESAIRASIEEWKNLSPQQIENAVNSFLSCLRSALLPIEKQTLMVIGRSVLRTEDKVDLLLSLFEQYLIQREQDSSNSQGERSKNHYEEVVSNKYDDEIPATTTILNEGRLLQIVVSQMFRLADLLTHPEGVRAKRFYEIITNSNKYRRFLNRKEGLELKPFGTLRPVTVINDQFNTFWKTAIPDLRREVDPLRFIPFELDLSQHLKTLKPDPGSVLESALKGDLPALQNIQIHGNLRIYPPGTGIIRMSMTLEFKQGIHIEISAELARNIESLLFIDPNDPNIDGKPCESIFLEIIDKVAETFFREEMFIGAERRWQPPETMFNFRDFHGYMLDNKIEVLAKLMSYAPANYEKLRSLEGRVSKALKYSHWQNARVFSVVGQGVALVIIPVSDAPGKRENQKKLMNTFVNARELVSAASYATKSFAERIDEIIQDQRLNSNWAIENEVFIEELYSIFFTMRRVMLAVSSIHGHLHSLGRGELMTFAKDLWIYDNPVDMVDIVAGLENVLEKLSSNPNVSPRVQELQKIIKQIIQIRPPFH